ncbi:MAG: DHH family phosphoesterase [Nanoarchaeota archaeon]|nr:DHH family phosphoesterase [Nanoarchaeota archaeon]
MITEKQIEEIKGFLQKSENPLFFFDDDADGLCSFLLLKKYIDRGKGVVIKSAPFLDASFLRKIEEYSPDVVFVLDKPNISEDFISGVHVPLVWIDHHSPVDVKGVKYFNPRVRDHNVYLPTSYICYQVVKQNLWIAMCGAVGDWLIPDFMDEFMAAYPGLVEKTDNPGDILFKQPLGELIKMMSFILKGKTSDVNTCISILSKIESPYELLNKTTSRAKFMYKKFDNINKEYKGLLDSAVKSASDDNLLVFYYPSKQMSFTGDLSNELSYLFPDKLVIVGRRKNDEFRLSLRSKKHKLPKIIEKALEGVEGYGGGHEYACGGNIKAKDIDKFVANLRRQLE